MKYVQQKPTQAYHVMKFPVFFPKWKAPPVSHFNTKHLVLWTTPKTLEPQWRNHLKELQIRSGLHSLTHSLTHSQLSGVKYFHAFVSTLNYVSLIGANSDKRRWSCDKKLKVFIGNKWIPKIMVQFCYNRKIFWHWYCLLSSVTMDGRLQGLKMDWILGQQKDTRYKSSTRLIQVIKVAKKVTLK